MEMARSLPLAVFRCRLFLMPRPRRLIRAQCVAAWVCAFSLVLVLANRFPRIAGCDETSWVLAAPSHITAKVMAKDFFVLPPPAAVRILLPRSVPLRIEAPDEQPLVSTSLDNRLFTRPPPSA
jgi:hypothetical protein